MEGADFGIIDGYGGGVGGGFEGPLVAQLCVPPSVGASEDTSHIQSTPFPLRHLETRDFEARRCSRNQVLRHVELLTDAGDDAPSLCHHHNAEGQHCSSRVADGGALTRDIRACQPVPLSQHCLHRSSLRAAPSTLPCSAQPAVPFTSDFSINIQLFPLQGNLPNRSLVFSPQQLLHRPQPSLLG